MATAPFDFGRFEDSPFRRAIRDVHHEQEEQAIDRLLASYDAQPKMRREIEAHAIALIDAVRGGGETLGPVDADARI